MKVDKGVCTTNDAYFAGNNTTNELSSIIKFETVFTTLVENKILAIKRECEQHESKKKKNKKSRSLKSLLHRKASVAESGQKFFLRKIRAGKPLTDVDIEKGGHGQVPAATVNDDIDNDKVDDDNDDDDDDDDDDELVNVVVQSGNADETHEKTIDVKLDSQSNELDVADADALTSSRNLNYADVKQNCDKLIISHTDNAQVPLSTNISSIVVVHKQKESTVAEANDELSLDTTIDISLQQQSSAVQQQQQQHNTNNTCNNNKQQQQSPLAIINDRSDVAICDDGASSQNTSDIEFSLVSENSINELPAVNVTQRKRTTTTNSDPIIKKQAVIARDKKQCERKAKSCQSTPIFGRATAQHQHVRSESEGKKVLTFQKELPKAKGVDTVKSQTIVIAPTSTTTTTTTTLATKPITTVSGPLETVHKKALQSRHSKHRDVSIEYEITYDNEDGTQSPHGFISSFNQLTSQKQPAAIISANLKKQSSKGGTHTTKEGKSQLNVDEEEETAAAMVVDDKKTAKNHEIELELDELGIDAVCKKKKRRSELFLFYFILNVNLRALHK
jgi:hypothetical protein